MNDKFTNKRMNTGAIALITRTMKTTPDTLPMSVVYIPCLQCHGGDGEGYKQGLKNMKVM